METLGNIIQQNSSKKYNCIICHYNTSRKCNYDTHLISKRHIKKSSEIQQKFSKSNYSCQKCNKQYRDRSGLWKHKKTCSPNEENTKKLSEIDKDDLIIKLLKQNAELINWQQDMMLKATNEGKNDKTN
jgi:hypothetical protein